MDFRPRQPDERHLSGPWRVHTMDLSLKRAGADADLDDSSWQQIEVPGHWGQSSDLADADGPYLYRRRFTHRLPEQDERLWLRFDGVLNGGEIWLDGSYIGDTTSYFAPHRFDVTSHLQGTEDHLLAVEVSCPSQSGSGPKSSLTGSLQAGHLAPAGNPGGIWRDVGIDSTGPVAIRYSRLLCTLAEPNRAELLIRLVLDVDHQTEIRIDTSVTGPDGSAGGGAEERTLASGENRIEWTVPIEGPRLWWPAALGEQPLYDVAVAVRLDDGRLSDRKEWRTGLRQVTVDDFVWRVNHERLFTKGIVAGPADPFLNRVNGSDLAKDMQAVRDAGLDLVRLHGHVGRAELYQEADRLGLLIWQDLPLVGKYSSKVRLMARAMAREAVDHLGHHPSVGLWCGRTERMGNTAKSAHHAGSAGARIGTGPKAVGRQLLPGWNRSIFDPLIARELRNADRTRSVVTRSGTPPSPSDPAGSDTHLWLGWESGLAEDLPRLLRRWPRLATFLGGIGSQSAEVQDWTSDAPDWPGASKDSFDRYLPRAAYGDGRSWALATRAYQADLLRAHIETIRRLKYRPAGGFLVTALADAAPGGGFGVLEYDRSPKPAYNALIDACRPVVVVCDPPPSILVPGQHVSLAVHVVSDLHRTLDPVRVTARAHGSGWDHSTAWTGEVSADCCQWIGNLDFEAPSSPQQLRIDLELQCGEVAATNRYTTVVIPASEAIG